MADTPNIHKQPLTFEWHDPRLVAGEPIAAVDAAARQFGALMALTGAALAELTVVVRNAAQTDILTLAPEADLPSAWDTSWQSDTLSEIEVCVDHLQTWANRTLKVYAESGL